MKHFAYIVLMMTAMCLASCIDEYNVDPKGSNVERLVVEGHIVSNATCRFTLHHTAPLSSPVGAFDPVTNAIVLVFEEYEMPDHEIDHDYSLNSSPTVSVEAPYDCFGGYELSEEPGTYYVFVGNLKPDSRYYLYIDHPDYGVFKSEPQYPLDAPELDSIGHSGGNGEYAVSINVTTGEMKERTFLMWDYEEYWEIYTPFTARYKYDVTLKDYVPLYPETNTNHGWGFQTNNSLIVACNDDYGYGKIQQKTLYDRQRDDLRFTNLYCARIRQMAITEVEYEYYNLLNKQTSEMGGIFTPMPAELPSNIVGENGEKAVGYIGVRGKIGFKDLYLSRSDVGCQRYDVAELLPDSLVKEPEIMIRSNYRVYDRPFFGPVKWTERWSVDCQDPYWGEHVTLEKPFFWIY